jgi:hypothetical protein
VFQRPQHLMTRFARRHRVFYVEEPVFDTVSLPRWEFRRTGRVTVAVPHLPHELPQPWRLPALRALVDVLVATERIDRFVAWYYTPDFLPSTNHLPAAAVVYDCLDLAALTHGAAERSGPERTLIARADVVFTGGYSLLVARGCERPGVGRGPVLFAVNDATRVISPARTVESPTAGTPVTSTAIATVVRMSRDRDHVPVAQEVRAFTRSCDAVPPRPLKRRQARADAALRARSWERTWTRMAALVERAVDRRAAVPAPHQYAPTRWPPRTSTSQA